MKKIVSLIVMAAMLAVSTPSYAGHERDYRWGVDHGGRQHSGSHRGHHRGGVSTGEAVAIGIGALLLGTVIANSNNNRSTRVERVERNYYPVQRQQQYVCQDVIQYDYYNNPYVAGRNCWYQ